MRYDPINVNSVPDSDSIAVDGPATELSRSIIAVGLHATDADSAQALCLRLSRHLHENVRGNALLALGHLARRFGVLDEPSVRPAVAAG